ncbi:MAG: UbiA family prenyltransferase, partial [Haloarculaceae archaeon]
TGSGPVATGSALASQVHPVFMLPALATAVFGALLAGDVNLTTAGLHTLAVGLGLYAAHVTDGYVDFYIRDEDDTHPLSRRGCRVALWGAGLAFWVVALTLGVLAGLGALLITVPGWLVAMAHAPQLDTNPFGATLGYPAGICLALLGGYYVQAGRFSATVLGLAACFLVVLAGIKVVDDATDVHYDTGIGKRTVAVVVGPARARQVAFALVGAGSVGVVGMAMTLPGIPPSAGLAVLPFLAVAALAWRAGPELATKLLVRGSYLLLAVLVWAVWFDPLG